MTYKDATTGQPVSGKTLNVTFKENLNDIDGSKTNDTNASIRKTTVNISHLTKIQQHQLALTVKKRSKLLQTLLVKLHSQ